MRILDHVQPEAALRYFEEICAIPHGSRNTGKIADYLVAFAEKQGLRCLRDESNNVVIWKAGTPGYEDHPTVILQGHTDMVCEKDADCDIDFETEGLRLATDGEYLYAKGTTLGGDDGIAVAYALAILASTDIPHPPMEAVFTVDEEIGMLGAEALDMSVLKGRILLNCDSEDEGILTVSCAGGATSCLTRPIEREVCSGPVYRIGVKELIGGHSGVEINKGRANANKVLAQILKDLAPRLICVNGGSKDNAIPRASEALVAGIREEDFFAAAEAAKKTLPETETASEFYCLPAQTDLLPMTADCSAAVISLLSALPNGVQAMSKDIPGLVQTSLNLGILLTQEDKVTMTFSVRSSVNEEKRALIETVKTVGAAHGAVYTESGAYPAWEYNQNSRLRDTMVEAFEKLYGYKPVVEAIHAGLECGLFCDRLPGLDAVSFGPKMHDIHTSRERLDLASTERTWNYLLEILARL